MVKKRKKFECWQITWKERSAAPMGIYEARSIIQAMLWLVRNLSGYKIVVVTRIEEND